MKTAKSHSHCFRQTCFQETLCNSKLMTVMTLSFQNAVVSQHPGLFFDSIFFEKINGLLPCLQLL